MRSLIALFFGLLLASFGPGLHVIPVAMAEEGVHSQDWYHADRISQIYEDNGNIYIGLEEIPRPYRLDQGASCFSDNMKIAQLALAQNKIVYLQLDRRGGTILKITVNPEIGRRYR